MSFVGSKLGMAASGNVKKMDILIINEGTDKTNYDVEIKINTAKIVSIGKLDQACTRIMFKDENNNILDHWIEGNANTTSTIFWIQCPAIPKGNFKIKLYYNLKDDKKNPEKTWNGQFILMSGSFTHPSWTRYTKIENGYYFPKIGPNYTGTLVNNEHSHYDTRTITLGSSPTLTLTYGERGTEVTCVTGSHSHNSPIEFTMNFSAGKAYVEKTIKYYFYSNSKLDEYTNLIFLFDPEATIPDNCSNENTGYQDYYPVGYFYNYKPHEMNIPKAYNNMVKQSSTAEFSYYNGTGDKIEAQTPFLHNHYIVLDSNLMGNYNTTQQPTDVHTVIPKYRNFAFIKNNDNKSLNSDFFSLTTGAPPLGWENYSSKPTYNGYHPRVGKTNTYGEGTRNSSHGHTYYFRGNTTSRSGAIIKLASSGGTRIQNNTDHDHRCSPTSYSVSYNSPIDVSYIYFNLFRRKACEVTVIVEPEFAAI